MDVGAAPLEEEVVEARASAVSAAASGPAESFSSAARSAPSARPRAAAISAGVSGPSASDASGAKTEDE